MKDLAASAPSQEGDLTNLLELYTVYIQHLVKTQFPSNTFAVEILDLEIDEVIQMVRIKLWGALQKQSINYPKAYIRKIVYNIIVDKMRQRQRFSPLSVNDEGELCQGKALINPGKGMRDPAYEFEEQEVDSNVLKCIVAAIYALPSRQKYALMCRLKDNLDDALVLIDFLRNLEIDPKTAQWPEEKADRQVLKSSLAVVRRKIQALLSEEYSL